MGVDIVALLPIIRTGLAAPLIGLFVKWAGAWLDAKTKNLGVSTTSAVIEYLANAVTKIVENTGAAIVDKVRAAYEDGKATEAEWADIKTFAHDTVIAELKSQVPTDYQAILKAAIESGLIDQLIAYAVNMRAKKAEETVCYEAKTIKKEIARYKAEHPEQ